MPNSTMTLTIAYLTVESEHSYPAWTFDELAFPVVQVSPAPASLDLLADAASNSVETTLQIIRGALNCMHVPANRA